MRKGNLTQRIEKIYQLIDHWSDASALDLSKQMSQPIGTISACLSYMVKGGYLYRNNRLYTIRVKTDPREVALKIRGFIKENKAIKKEKQLIEARSDRKNFQIEIDDYAAETSLAIELLKSRGYKVLAPVTEFKEI